MKKLFIATFSLILLTLCACEKPKSVSGKILGAWQTEWTDDLEGDLDEITVNETILFEAEGNSKSKGSFMQMFIGSVEFDNNKKEKDLNYVVHVSGVWSVKDRNNVILRYDVKDMQVEVGVNSAENNYSTALSHLVTGNWSGFILAADENLSDKDVQQANKLITKYFKSKFLEINKDKKGLSSVVIEDDMMTCKAGGGWIGRKLTYDRVNLDAVPKTAPVAATPAGLPNYDWLSTREVTYADIADKSKAELRIMRNYMFAKHGYRFKSPDLQQYFAQYPWYQAVSDNVIYDMNSFEKNNVEFIKRFE